MKEFKRPIGGERLGAGKRMEVDMRTYDRSTFDLGHIWRSTMSAGTLVPFLCTPMLPGDTFDINIENFDVLTLPTEGPLFGSYKVQLDVFQIPMRLYMSALHNNKLGVGNRMQDVKLPKLRKAALTKSEALSTNDVNNAEISGSCILSYLGYRGSGLKLGGTTRDTNAIPLFAYHDIYKNYYANKQEEHGYVIDAQPTTLTITSATIDGNAITTSSTTPYELISTADLEVVITAPYIAGYEEAIQLWVVEDNKWVNATEIYDNFNLNVLTMEYYAPSSGYYGKHVTKYRQQRSRYLDVPQLQKFPLANIDTLREKILATAPYTEFVVNGTQANTDIYPVGCSIAGSTSAPLLSRSRMKQQGLLLKTYQNDIFNNYLNKEWLDNVTTGINAITAVDVSSGKLMIDSLVLSKKLYNVLNRVAISGGSYKDWIEATYTENFFMSAESPIYIGGASKELSFEEIVSNAATVTNERNQPLGSLAGKGRVSRNTKGGKIIAKAQEFSYLMGIISITPRIDYSQGNSWDIMINSMDNWHKPELDAIGFQDIVQERQAWWTSVIASGNAVTRLTTGKQPAWIEYMTAVNKTLGNFAENEQMWMTLNRRYEGPNASGANVAIEDNTTYIDPSKFNYIFADARLDAQNFWAQIDIDIKARRKISSKVMPNL